MSPSCDALSARQSLYFFYHMKRGEGKPLTPMFRRGASSLTYGKTHSPTPLAQRSLPMSASSIGQSNNGEQVAYATGCNAE